MYFGYKRFSNGKGVAKGYVQFGVDGEIDEIIMPVQHEFLYEYLEFFIGKSSAPLFNGQMAKI